MNPFFLPSKNKNDYPIRQYTEYEKLNHHDFANKYGYSHIAPILQAKSDKKNTFTKAFDYTYHTLVSAGLPVAAILFIAFLSFQNGQFEYQAKVASAKVYEVTESFQSKQEGPSSDVEGVIDQNQEDTEESVVILENVDLQVPLIKQIYSLSCEVASLEMALKYHGVETNQDLLMEELGISAPLKIQKQGSKIVWGDPDEGFVGDVKGWFTGKNEGVESLELATGWGVNNGPIASIAKEYLPNSYEVDNGNITDIKEALSAGNPVLWWHVRPDSFAGSITIYTQSGEAKEFRQMHVGVITGYKTVNGVTNYTINDPYFEELVLTESELLDQWQLQDYQLVVVGK